MTAGRYVGLDGLRGLASFAVVVHHSLIMGTDIGGQIGRAHV
jgi:peptidoglycan/LPS O-acetylase OafA/YrhL